MFWINLRAAAQAHRGAESAVTRASRNSPPMMHERNQRRPKAAKRYDHEKVSGVPVHRLTKCRLKNSIALGHESAAACGL
jgi:hypothetical protein